MSLGSGWRRLLRLSLGRRSVERAVDDEIAFHIAMREEKLRRLGLAPDAAYETARERFGDPRKFRSECISIDTQHHREVRMMDWIESVWSDVRYALRTLRRNPVFTTVVTVTFALGIGATTAMFTLVDGILLRPLPFPESDRLVRVIQSYPEMGLDTWGLSPQNVTMYARRARDFTAFAAINGRPVTMTGTDHPERLSTARVSAGFFDVVGVHPTIGRVFATEEDLPNRNNVIILSHSFWQSRFGGDTSVLGRVLTIDGKPSTVIGIMPRGFTFPRPDVQVWIPAGLDSMRRNPFTFAGIARLKPGVTVKHAELETTRIMWDWARAQPAPAGKAMPDPARTRMKTIVEPLRESMTGASARPLMVLLGAVSLILLIAIANVATLLLTRATGRGREIGLRAALGATSRRVVRQLMTESIALALLGAVIGVLLAAALVRTFARSSLASLPRIEEVGVDGRVLAFTLVVSILSGVAFGLVPAIHGARARFHTDLSGSGTGRMTVGSRRINSVLVVMQLALSVILLVAAGLMVKSFRKLVGVELGFRPENVTVVQLPLPQTYEQQRVTAFIQTLLNEVRALPAVRAASLSWYMPYDGNTDVNGFVVDGRPVPPSGAETTQATQVAVSPGYFATLGIPILRGRDFVFSDDTAGVPAVIIDNEMAKRYWPDVDPIGKRLRAGGDTSWLTVVGVVGSTRDEDAAMVPRPHMYFSLAQSGAFALSLAVRTSTEPSAVIASLRRTIAGVEPAIPIEAPKSLTSLIGKSLDDRRLIELLLGGFALLAVTLAGVGIYGVMSLHVANRRREFGIRLAVGAAPAKVVRLVLGEGAALAAAGVVLGVIGARVASRWIQSLLYDVSATDPIVFAGLALVLAAIAIGSCWIPALRAARSDPLQVLRAD